MMADVNARVSRGLELSSRALARLRQARVTVVGAGMLGGQLAFHLGMLGIRLTLIDGGLVRSENLGNQLLPASGVGRPKSIVRAGQITACNPECNVTPIVSQLEELGFAALAGTDVVATALDSQRSRLAVNERAFRLNVPWVDAAVDGTGRSLLGAVTFYDPRTPSSPCYMCRLSPASLTEIISRERRAGCPSWRVLERPVTQPTLQCSAFGAVVAGWQALSVIEAVLGRSQHLVGTQLLVTAGKNPSLRRVRLSINPHCLFDHSHANPLSQFSGPTVGELLARASADLGQQPDELRFPGLNIAGKVRCPGCGSTRQIMKNATALSQEDVRCNCGKPGEMQPLELLSSIEQPSLRHLTGVNWHDLGLPRATLATVLAGTREAHYIINRKGSTAHSRNLAEELK